jgi:hypothetical protein
MGFPVFCSVLFGFGDNNRMNGEILIPGVAAAGGGFRGNRRGLLSQAPTNLSWTGFPFFGEAACNHAC